MENNDLQTTYFFHSNGIHIRTILCASYLIQVSHFFAMYHTLIKYLSLIITCHKLRKKISYKYSAVPVCSGVHDNVPLKIILGVQLFLPKSLCNFYAIGLWRKHNKLPKCGVLEHAQHSFLLQHCLIQWHAYGTRTN